MAETRVKGLAELQKAFADLPEKIERNIIRSALRSAGKVIEAEAKRLVPVATPNAENQRLYGGYAGALRDSIRTSVRLRGGQPVATVKAGGSTKRGGDAYYAHFVEFGTAAHFIGPSKAGGGLFIAGNYRRGVQHPGAKKRPFMRPAIDRSVQAAIQAFADQVRKRLTKEGIETAPVEIEEG